MVSVGDGNVLAVVALGGPGAASTERDDIEANARLIAAAPDLLEALANLLDEAQAAGFGNASGFQWPQRITAAKAAIAKAGEKGEG